MHNNYNYYYNRTQNTVTSNRGFQPNENNWLISARSANNNYYFSNLTSYNHWANTCCGQSHQSIDSGSFNGYTITKNY